MFGEFLDENKNPIDYEQIVTENDGIRDVIKIPKILNKKIIIAQHKTSVGKTYLPDVADETFVWSSEVELLNSVRESIQKLNYV